MLGKWKYAVMALLLVSGTVHSANYIIDRSHSNVDFKIRHLVSKVRGEFTDYEGTVTFDPQNVQKTKVKATIKAATINTQNQKRDTHLRSADFFDVEKYPEITFVSKKAEPAGENAFKLSGDLTIHGVTKPVTLDVTHSGEAKDPWGSTRTGFSAKGQIDRKDFGILWNKALDNGGVLLGDEVEILLEVEAVKVEAAKNKKEK